MPAARRRRGNSTGQRPRPRRPRRPPLCRVDGDRLIFDARVTAAAALDAIAALSQARRDGAAGLTLDFSQAQRAYPEAMMQIVAHVEHLRRAGMHFDLIAPADRRLASVFDASNWAHIINPAMYDASAY